MNHMDIMGITKSTTAPVFKQLPPTPELTQLEEVHSLHSFEKLAENTQSTSAGVAAPIYTNNTFNENRTINNKNNDK